MAVVHAYSVAVTDANASPPVRHTAGLNGRGNLVVEETVITVAGQSDILSTFSLFRIPSNAKVKRIVFQSTDQGTTGTVDIGAYYGPDVGDPTKYVSPPTTTGVSVIDVDFFLQAIDVTQATGCYADILPGGGFKLTAATPLLLAGGGGWTGAVANKELWDALAIATDPRCQIDIIASAHAAFDVGTGTFYARIEYIV